MPQALFDAMAKLAKSGGYTDPAMILARYRAREYRRSWWVVK